MAKKSPLSIENCLSFQRLFEGRCLWREFDQDFLDSTDPNVMSFVALFRCDEDLMDVSPVFSILGEK